MEASSPISGKSILCSPKENLPGFQKKNLATIYVDVTSIIILKC